MKKQKGFTLIEILVSGVVLALVMVGLATLMTYTMKSDSQARVRSYSTELAQSRIDFFRQERSILGWAGLSSVLETRTYCLNGVNSFSTSVDNNVFSGLPNGDNCPFVAVSGDIPAQIKQVASVEVGTNEINIEITVSWLNDSNEEVSVSSVFKLAKILHESGFSEPVVPTNTPVPIPTNTPIPPTPILFPTEEAVCCPGLPPKTSCIGGYPWVCNSSSCNWECGDGGSPL